MINDLFDKNGVWQGSQKEYFDYAKEIVDDVNDGDFLEDILNDLLKEIPQKRLESIISDHCENLEDQIGEDESNYHRLGLLINVKPKGENDQ
nr:hypothetical protein [uncultured Mediterranean phage uvMED]